MPRPTIRLVTILGLAAAFAALALPPVRAADPVPRDPAPTVQPTATFVALVAPSNLFEIESSQLALDRPVSPAVKGFARRMVEDHSAAGVRFREVVAVARVTAPPEKLDARHIAQIEALRAASDAQFEKAYLELQRKAHDEAVALFEGYAAGGENAALRAFAAELLPRLREHRVALDSLN